MVLRSQGTHTLLLLIPTTGARSCAAVIGSVDVLGRISCSKLRRAFAGIRSERCFGKKPKCRSNWDSTSGANFAPYQAAHLNRRATTRGRSVHDKPIA